MDLKGYWSGGSVIPWLFLRRMTIILAIISSSETKLTTNRMICGKEMMTIVTTARTETMTTIKTMISNKEMLTILGSSETIMTTIIY